jgi:hypothetical protein
MIILACIDGGLICVPVAIIMALGGGTLVTAFFRKFRRVCKTSCHCECHPVKEGETNEQSNAQTKVTRD